MNFEQVKIGMYFRCSIEESDEVEPRDFAMGQVTELFTTQQAASLQLNDPFGYKKFYSSIPDYKLAKVSNIERCKFQNKTMVQYKGIKCEVLESVKDQNGFFNYYLRRQDDMKIILANEKDIIAPFTGERVFPATQLKNYEFQNPCWYDGHNIVKRTMSVLENSMYGFKELAGCRIFLKSYQMQTIMRCLQAKEIRYMIADEVGLGKTVEACSILKIFMKDRCNQKILLVVPQALQQQWRMELLMKFGVVDGKNDQNNLVKVITHESLCDENLANKWDFIIVDEVHKILKNQRMYNVLHLLSEHATNVLLLSATPVQERKGEYLNLLRLLEPNKYDFMSEEAFTDLIKKQISISSKVVAIYDNISEIESIVNEVESIDELTEDDLSDIEYCFDDIESANKQLIEIIGDQKIEELANDIEFNMDLKWIEQAKILIGYISEYYQIDKNVIRNRRTQIEEEFASRELIEIPYELNNQITYRENEAYQDLCDFLENLRESSEEEQIEQVHIDLLQAFSSSPWAYLSTILKLEEAGIYCDELKSSAYAWEEDENKICASLVDALDQPERYQTRMIQIINLLEEKFFGEKVVLFTNKNRTLKKYYEVFKGYFAEDEVVLFSNDEQSVDENDKSIYLFQQDPNCHILICDHSGAEGRNLQGADAVVHIDLPWKADEIEQRIGRLDRFGRNEERPVISVVPYTVGTVENELFKFFKNGLKVFNQPLSGLEIVIEDINKRISDALVQDSVYGLATVIPDLMDVAEKMKKSVRMEQIYDASSYKYKPLNVELKQLVDSYTAKENDLFTSAMLSWASLAGFKGFRDYTRELVCFSEKSFSVNSAKNTLLIPPNWEAYENREEYKKRITIQREFETSEDRARLGTNIIKGTFNRALAIKCDYLHFFAPGDEIFDCIVNNALHSSKGQSCAFALKSNLEWRGLIFTWSVQADLRGLLKEGVSLYTLSQFNRYLSDEQVYIAIPFSGYEDVPLNQVIQEYKRSSGEGLRKTVEHLGKRGKGNNFMSIKSDYGVSNIDYFKAVYREENWQRMIDEAMAISLEKAKVELFKKSKLEEAEKIIEEIVNSTIASRNYYNLKDVDAEQISKELDCVYKSLSKPRFVLDSACCFWLVR